MVSEHILQRAAEELSKESPIHFQTLYDRITPGMSTVMDIQQLGFHLHGYDIGELLQDDSLKGHAICYDFNKGLFKKVRANSTVGVSDDMRTLLINFYLKTDDKAGYRKELRRRFPDENKVHRDKGNIFQALDAVDQLNGYIKNLEIITSSSSYSVKSRTDR